MKSEPPAFLRNLFGNEGTSVQNFRLCWGQLAKTSPVSEETRENFSEGYILFYVKKSVWGRSTCSVVVVVVV